MGLGRLGLRRWLAVLGFLLGTGLGVCLGSLVVWPLLVWRVAGLLVLSGLQLRLVRRSAAVQTGFVAEFILRPRPVGKPEPTKRRTILPRIAPTMMTTISISTPDRAQATTAQSRTARPRSPKLRRTVRLQRLSRLLPRGSRFLSPGSRCAQG